MNTPSTILLEAESPAAPRTPRQALTVMIAAALLSAVCGVAQTLWIPRVLPVQAFGYWRMFLLYAGYAGLLHLGLVDGALLAWSNRLKDQPLPSIHSAFQFLAGAHLTLLVPIIFLASIYATPPVAYLVLALAVYALLFNLAGLAQVRLQTDLRFSAVAFGLCAPATLFVASFAVLAHFPATAGPFLVAYLAAWAITVAVLLWLALRSPVTASASSTVAQLPGTWKTGRRLIAMGWPIVLANTGFGLMQSADRVTVNLTRPIHDFAIYSLSQSTIYVPITLLAAVSRVAFSYFARLHGDGRPAFYRSSTRLLTLSWMLLLPYFFVVEAVVRRFLPRYVGGLPAGRILLLSVLFLSLIQIVQLNAFSLAGRQRQFFVGSVGAVAMAFATAWVGSRMIGPLTAVAWSQVLTAGLWWAGNEWFLDRSHSLERGQMLLVLASFCIGTVALYLSGIAGVSFSVKAASYYALSLIPVCLIYSPELRSVWQVLPRLELQRSERP